MSGPEHEIEAIMTRLRESATALRASDAERVARLVLGELGAKERAKLEARAEREPALALALEQARLPNPSEIDRAVEVAMSGSSEPLDDPESPPGAHFERGAPPRPRSPTEVQLESGASPRGARGSPRGLTRRRRLGVGIGASAAAAALALVFAAPTGLPSIELMGLEATYAASDVVRLELRAEDDALPPEVEVRSWVRAEGAWRPLELPWAREDGGFSLEVPARLLVNDHFGARELRVGIAAPGGPDVARVAETFVAWPAFALVEARPTRAATMAGGGVVARFPEHEESGLVLELEGRSSSAPTDVAAYARIAGRWRRADEAEVESRGAGHLSVELPRRALETEAGRADRLAVAVGEGSPPEGSTLEGGAPPGWTLTFIELEEGR